MLSVSNWQTGFHKVLMDRGHHL